MEAEQSANTQIFPDAEEEYHETNILKGTFGEVVLAQENGETIAIKRIKKSMIAKNKRIKQLKREILMMKKVDHENIVKFKDFNTENSTYYEIKMEYCEGKNLKSYLLEESYPYKNYSRHHLYFPLKVCLDYLNALCEIRKHMIINRDIKCDNIMIKVEPNGKVIAKMIDLGEACFSINEAFSQVGTNGYMAPEVYFGMKSYSEACDNWSLGIVLYEIFTWANINKKDKNKTNFTTPFKENLVPESQNHYNEIYNNYIWEGLSLKVNTIPEPFRQIIRGLLRPDPEKRMTIFSFIDTLIKNFDAIKVFLGTEEEIEKEFNKLNQCLINEKETMSRKHKMKKNISNVEILYRFFTKISDRISENENEKTCQIIRLLSESIKFIIMNIYDVSVIMELDFKDPKYDDDFNEILGLVINKEEFNKLGELYKEYEEYLRNFFIESDLEFEEPETEKYLRVLFGEEHDEIIKKVKKLFEDE